MVPARKTGRLHQIREGKATFVIYTCVHIGQDTVRVFTGDQVRFRTGQGLRLQRYEHFYVWKLNGARAFPR